MADFSKSVAGAYFITSCYKYAVATGIFFCFLLFLNFLSFNSFHCCFHLKFYITFLYCARVTTLPLVRRRFFFLTAALGAARALLKLQYSPLLALDLMMAVALKIQGRLQDPEDGGLCASGALPPRNFRPRPFRRRYV